MSPVTLDEYTAALALITAAETGINYRRAEDALDQITGGPMRTIAVLNRVRRLGPAAIGTPVAVDADPAPAHGVLRPYLADTDADDHPSGLLPRSRAEVGQKPGIGLPGLPVSMRQPFVAPDWPAAANRLSDAPGAVPPPRRVRQLLARLLRRRAPIAGAPPKPGVPAGERDATAQVVAFPATGQDVA